MMCATEKVATNRKLVEPTWESVHLYIQNYARKYKTSSDQVYYEDSDGDMIEISDRNDFETCIEDLHLQKLKEEKLLLWIGSPDKVTNHFKARRISLKTWGSDIIPIYSGQIENEVYDYVVANGELPPIPASSEQKPKNNSEVVGGDSKPTHLMVEDEFEAESMLSSTLSQ